MKKIGILYGKERAFPEALIERINSRKIKNLKAEPVYIEKVMQGEPGGFVVIIDRISHDVPFYRSYLKNEALCGTAVINNPFWWSADDKFFNNALATKIKVPVPKTVILPSRDLPPDTTDESFSNLAYPMDWESIFEYIGFPAYMKPFMGGGWKNIYKVTSVQDFFTTHAETGGLVMMLQEEILFDEYYRCYCVGGKNVLVMGYDPRQDHEKRYRTDFKPDNKKIKLLEDLSLRINNFLGYDFNTVEFALKDGIPYAIDFFNPAPDADPQSVGKENFEWVLEAASDYAIQRAQDHKPGKDNLTWGKFLKRSVNKEKLAD